ncbi:hypothetical protein [Escherichia coli]
MNLLAKKQFKSPSATAVQVNHLWQDVAATQAPARQIFTAKSLSHKAF